MTLEKPVPAGKTVLQIRYRDDALRTTCNQYLEAFSDGFHRVVVFLTGAENDEIKETLSADEIIFLELNQRQLKGLRRHARRELVQIVKRIAPTLIIAHRWKATTIAVAALRELSAKDITVFSIVHALCQLQSLSRRLIGRFILRKYCCFIGVSEAVREDVLQAGFGFAPDKVLVLPNCVDIEKTRALLLPRSAARQRLELPDDIPVIGHIGRLVRAKDQKTLISAFARLRESLPMVRLVIIGEGYFEADLKAQVDSLQLPESAVIFTGAQDNAVRFMQAFDIFTLTSVAEGFPRVLLEALVCKIPIVATDSGGIPEVLGNEAQLCQAGNVDEISSRLHEVLQLNAEARRELVDTGFARVSEKFSREIFRKRLLAFVS